MAVRAGRIARTILRGNMILAIDADLWLHVFEAEEEVYRKIEAIDIENHEYEFCDDVGQRFIPRIVLPVTTFRNGTFKLIPDGEKDLNITLSFLSRAKGMANRYKGIASLDSLRTYLEQRQHG